MPISLNHLDQVIQIIKEKSADKRRFMIAISACPGAGKSTLSQQLLSHLQGAKIVQMDGFHLSNEVLSDQGLLSRKGSPASFDLSGLKHLIQRLKQGSSDSQESIYAPRFDRELDASIGSAVAIESQDKYILIEGNYLLLDQEGWRDLKADFDLSLFLEVDESTLITRLTRRWLDLGLDEKTALSKVQNNDALNIKTVNDYLLAPDIFLNTANS
ncbi:kinase-related protein [Marinomonas sp. MED121]|uniref:kinase-related protein n=1 Tax=Marinomonas sp. MED121 TaxID=314277 RepID=UPI00006902F2|nr:kinase-related protein [Marinomonas sp. MED121]EAQ66347.1 kinase-related protein [Marinomonas sp. MED121]